MTEQTEITKQTEGDKLKAAPSLPLFPFVPSSLLPFGLHARIMRAVFAITSLAGAPPHINDNLKRILKRSAAFTLMAVADKGKSP